MDDFLVGHEQENFQLDLDKKSQRTLEVGMNQFDNKFAFLERIIYLTKFKSFFIKSEI